ncbi:proline-rich receptor-like protein kinase PERK9, partial [Aplysia californica]|uniref:Proline-rich receptor-like protein kinase PERK9 n=1 Tax=Aplysia californica TaxID=6500 RepID=A0ABM0KBB2_APLCA
GGLRPLALATHGPDPDPATSTQAPPADDLFPAMFPQDSFQNVWQSGIWELRYHNPLLRGLPRGLSDRAPTAGLQSPSPSPSPSSSPAPPWLLGISGWEGFGVSPPNPSPALPPHIMWSEDLFMPSLFPHSPTPAHALASPTTTSPPPTNHPRLTDPLPPAAAAAAASRPAAEQEMLSSSDDGDAGTAGGGEKKPAAAAAETAAMLRETGGGDVASSEEERGGLNPSAAVAVSLSAAVVICCVVVGVVVGVMVRRRQFAARESGGDNNKCSFMGVGEGGLDSNRDLKLDGRLNDYTCWSHITSLNVGGGDGSHAGGNSPRVSNTLAVHNPNKYSHFMVADNKN